MPPIGFEERDDAVGVRGKGWPRKTRNTRKVSVIVPFVSFVFFVVNVPEVLVAAVGVDQPRLVEAVAAHQAGEGVGDQSLDVLCAVGPVERDLVVGDGGGQFVLQAVGVDEQPVVLFSQLLHPLVSVQRKSATSVSLRRMRATSNSGS